VCWILFASAKGRFRRRFGARMIKIRRRAEPEDGGSMTPSRATWRGVEIGVPSIAGGATRQKCAKARDLQLSNSTLTTTFDADTVHHSTHSDGRQQGQCLHFLSLDPLPRLQSTHRQTPRFSSLSLPDTTSMACDYLPRSLVNRVFSPRRL
jgi:hypothetical protein